MIHDALGAFSAEECERIIALRDSETTTPGHVWRGDGYHVDANTRLVSTSYQPRGPATAWLYARLDALFAEAAAAIATPVGPIAEPLQVLRYAVGDHYKVWHTDVGADLGATRRISVSVELSELADHDGGALQIVPSAMSEIRTVPRGGARFFPSRMLHRVAPVTRGVRHALVIWAPAP